MVPDARIIPQLNVREAAELAYYGAKVLHPRALIPLADQEIPLFVRPFADPDQPGTEISARHTLDEYPVKALSAISAQALVTVAGRGLIGVPGVAGRTFATLSDARDVGLADHPVVVASSRSASPCPRRRRAPAKEHLERAFAAEIARREVDSVQVEPGMSTVAVVGLGMAGTPGIAARVFARWRRPTSTWWPSPRASSRAEHLVRGQGQRGGGRPRGPSTRRSSWRRSAAGAVTHAETVDVVLLGFGQIGRTLAGLLGKRKRQPARRDGSGRCGWWGWSTAAASCSITRGSARPAPGRAGGLEGAGQAVRHRRRRAGGHARSRRSASSPGTRWPGRCWSTSPPTRPGRCCWPALKAGMDLVLANKRPLSGPKSERDALLAMAEAHGRRVLFEATVGAGLPVLDTYRKLVESGDKVLKIEGCVSGTLGFLFTELGAGAQVLARRCAAAMDKGFTEPDPRDDLSGADVGRKALILGRLLGYTGEPGDVVVESLVPEAARGLTRDEFLQRLPAWDARLGEAGGGGARARAQVLRYVATVHPQQDQGRACRASTAASPFAALKGTDNQIAFTTTRYRSPLVIRGAGAGLQVTAGGVLNDILALVG